MLYNRHIAKHDVLRKNHDVLTGFTSRCWGWSYRKIVVSESIDRKRRFRKFGKNVQSSRWKSFKRPNLHLQNSTGCKNYVTWNFESLFIQTFPSSILDKFCTFFRLREVLSFQLKPVGLSKYCIKLTDSASGYRLISLRMWILLGRKFLKRRRFRWILTPVLPQKFYAKVAAILLRWNHITTSFLSAAGYIFDIQIIDMFLVHICRT